MSWGPLAHEGLGTLWKFASEIVRLDKADLGHFCLRRGVYRQGTLGLLLVAFGRGGVMVWIIRLVAGSQIPRHVLVVFKKRKRFQPSAVRCGIVANVHCDIPRYEDHLQVTQVSATTCLPNASGCYCSLKRDP